MSSSDPTSNLDSLNISTESVDVPAAVREAVLHLHLGVPVPKVCRGRDREGATCRKPSKVYQRFMILVDVWLLLQLVMKLVWNPSHHSCLQVFLPMGPRLRFTNTFEYHDQRSQQVHVGIDPMVFSNMVSEARRVIQESEEKAQGLEQLAQEVYQQACSRIQELVNLAESLYQSDCSKASEIEKLQRDVQSTRDQLQIQINRDQTLGFQITKFESQMSNI